MFMNDDMLRAYIAAEAAKTLLAQRENAVTIDEMAAKRIAKASVVLADALIAELNGQD